MKAKITANYLNNIYKLIFYGTFIIIDGFDFIASFNSGADLAIALNFQRFMASLLKSPN